MARAGGGALAWAVDLWRQPATRHALRTRPLPDGMERLLAIAGGAGSALVEAAAATGESPARLLELVRFALREQLFFPGADAYRTLGLSRDAPTQALRSHHRLLQQWLHPDRCDDEDAVFAARVNAAWDQLRTSERRQAYDSRLPPPPVATGAHAGTVVWRQGGLPERELRVVRWRQRAPLIALLAACIGLGALAVLEQARAPDLYASAPEPANGPDPLAALSGPPPPPRGSVAPPAPARAAAPAPRAPAPAPRLAPLPAGALSPPSGMPAPAAARAASHIAPSPAPAPAASTVAPAFAPAPAPDHAAAMAPPAPGPASTLVAQPAVASQPGPAPTRAHSAAESVAPSAGLPPDPQRVRAAQQVGDRLLGYLGGRSRRIPPIWSSLGAQQAAQAIREAITSTPRVVGLPPEWAISGESAQLTAGLQYPDGTEGRVRARLEWREERWLVSDVAMERDR